MGLGEWLQDLKQELGYALPDYANPMTEEFRKRQQAYLNAMQLPETRQAMERAEQEAFGSLGGSRAVGTEQAALAAALRAQAEGKGPSLAQMQYNQALGQTQAAIQSQLASARGLSPAQAQRIAARQQAAMGAGAASQSAMLRLQEQQAAQAALGNLLGQRRQQELLGGQLAAGMYGTSGGLGMDASRLRMGAAQAVTGQGAQQADMARQGTELGARMMENVANVGMKTATMGVGGKAKGGEIGGRAQYSGDTRSNDTVPAMLSPGEIVLPRTVAQSEDAPEKAKKFVEAIKKQKRPSPKAFMQAMSRLAELESRLDAMEALADLEAEQEG